MDILHDNSMRTWFQIGSSFEHLIPEYVMKYDLPAKEASATLSDSEFADPARRLYPVDSPAATWLSYAYFNKHAMDGDLPQKAIEIDAIKERILQAASVYGIQPDITKLAEAFTVFGVEKKAEVSDDNYGWVAKDSTGNVLFRKYPMFDAVGVKKASDYFAEYRHRYPLEIRKHIASNIMKAAATFNVPTTELKIDVRVEAGHGIPIRSVLMEELYERANLCKDAEVSIALANINELVAAAPVEELAQNLDKIAEVVDAFDKTAGLTKHYNKKIAMPSDIIYKLGMDEAIKMSEDSVTLHRHIFSIEKLAALPVNVFSDVLGDNFVKAVMDKTGVAIDRVKLADNLYSLPKPDKAALETHLKSLYS